MIIFVIIATFIGVGIITLISYYSKLNKKEWDSYDDFFKNLKNNVDKATTEKECDNLLNNIKTYYDNTANPEIRKKLVDHYNFVTGMKFQISKNNGLC